MMVIADGMGGHYYGEIAAQIAVQTLVESFQREATPEIRDPFMFLQRSMTNAHCAILDFTDAHNLKDSPRTTCVACVIQDNIAYWAHAGDSRLYLMRAGKVATRTRDHSRVQLLIDQGVINEAQAAVHPDRNKVYSCLGGRQTPEIEFSRKTPLEAGDVLALCTDGLWGVIPGEIQAVGPAGVGRSFLAAGGVHDDAAEETGLELGMDRALRAERQVGQCGAGIIDAFDAVKNRSARERDASGVFEQMRMTFPQSDIHRQR